MSENASPHVPTVEEMESMLPSRPGAWSDEHFGFKQRWLPGAFGDLEDISEVYGFRVLEEAWDDRAEDETCPLRTIVKAEVSETLAELRARAGQ